MSLRDGEARAIHAADYRIHGTVTTLDLEDYETMVMMQALLAWESWGQHG